MQIVLMTQFKDVLRKKNIDLKKIDVDVTM